MLDLDKIGEFILRFVDNTFDQIFLRKFFKTQTFCFWVEQHYEL